MRSTSSARYDERGQIPQIFLFIMALIVIGATIFLGMKLLGGLESAACSANDASFQQEVKRQLDRYAQFGTRDDVTVKPPCDAVALCFVDSRTLQAPGAFSMPQEEGNGVIVSSVKGGVMTNIFLKGREKTVPVGYDARIYLGERTAPAPDQATCIPAVGGKFTFNVQGYGRYAIVGTQ